MQGRRPNLGLAHRLVGVAPRRVRPHERGKRSGDEQPAADRLLTKDLCQSCTLARAQQAKKPQRTPRPGRVGGVGIAEASAHPAVSTPTPGAPDRGGELPRRPLTSDDKRPSRQAPAGYRFEARATVTAPRSSATASRRKEQRVGAKRQRGTAVSSRVWDAGVRVVLRRAGLAGLHVRRRGVSCSEQERAPVRPNDHGCPMSA